MAGMPMATDSSSMPIGMMMTFNTQNTALQIFSTAFSPVTTGQYVGAWFFCFILAVIWRALVLFLFKMDEHWTLKYAQREVKINNGNQFVSQAASVRAWRLSTNLPRALLSLLVQGVAYLL